MTERWQRDIDTTHRQLSAEWREAYEAGDGDRAKELDARRQELTGLPLADIGQLQYELVQKPMTILLQASERLSAGQVANALMTTFDRDLKEALLHELTRWKAGQ